MTRKTRYFMLAAGAVLVVGLGGGLIAYLAYNRAAAIPDGLPPEVRFVPANAAVIAFADVQGVTNSELRRSIAPAADPEMRRGRDLNNFVGVDLEKQVNRVVAYVEPYKPADPQSKTNADMPRALVLVQGTFDPGRIEAAIVERAGAMEEYKGRKMFVHREDNHEFAVGIIQPDLIAMGQTDIVRRVIDFSQDSSALSENITSNADMMRLIRDNAGSTAWVVGQFDEIRRRMRMPVDIAGQVPPVRLLSAKADINGGVRATIRAETGDKAAGDQLRDVVRGFISLARLQASGKQDFEAALKTVELTGTDTTVQLSFAVSPAMVRTIAPTGRRRGRGNEPSDPDPAIPSNPTTPAPPTPPTPPTSPTRP